MKTKIVYVVASLDDDIYMEQAIVSAWSARHYNPDCQIEMVCDQDTFVTLNSGIRAQYKSLFNKIHVREFQPEQSMMERSRWMKTTLREIIEGDYLYLDTDTVVCDDLSCVDEFTFAIGMVLDHNCHFNEFIYYERDVDRAKKLYNVDISQETHCYNSGVSYAKDTIISHKFFRSWHKLWLSKKDIPFGLVDQPSLAVVNKEYGYVIEEMSGNFNCQVMSSIQFLHTAKIIHFFSTSFTAKSKLSPFYGVSLYEHVKHHGVTDDIQTKILNCKSQFSSPSMPVPREVAMHWRYYMSSSEQRYTETSSYYLISFMHQRFPLLMRYIEKLISLMIRIAQIRK